MGMAGTMGRCLPAWVPPQMPNVGRIIAHQREMSICVLACPGCVWSGPGARPLPSPAGPLWAAWRNWEPQRVRNLGSVALESAGPAGGPIRKTAGGLRLKVAGAAVVVASAGRL